MGWSTRLRVSVSGVLWATVYNALWGIAWFTFMRRAWDDAFAAIGQPLAWSPPVWQVWILVTVPLGIALMAFAHSGHRPRLRALQGAGVLCSVFVLGMTVWGMQEAFALRVLVLDALVNVIAMPAAAVVAAELLPRRPPMPLPSGAHVI